MSPGSRPVICCSPCAPSTWPEGTDGAPTVLIADAAAGGAARRRGELGRRTSSRGAARAAGSSGSCPPTRRRAGSYGPCRRSASTAAVTLVADAGQHRVFAVDPGGALRWQYGVIGSPGSAPGYLDAPAGPLRLSNDRTLIVDGGNRRVIEVRTSDYRINGDLHGWDASSIRWQYPSADGSLDDPARCGPSAARRPMRAARLGGGRRGAALRPSHARRHAAREQRRRQGGLALDRLWARQAAQAVPGAALERRRARGDEPEALVRGLRRRVASAGPLRRASQRWLRESTSSPRASRTPRLKYTVSFTTSDRGLTPTLYDLAITYRSATRQGEGRPRRGRDGHGSHAGERLARRQRHRRLGSGDRLRVGFWWRLRYGHGQRIGRGADHRGVGPRAAARAPARLCPVRLPARGRAGVVGSGGRRRRARRLGCRAAARRGPAAGAPQAARAAGPSG